MAATRTPGITLGRDGRFFIDKRYRGVRIGMRVGPVTQEHAEQRLKTEMQQIDVERSRQARWRPTFADCAQRYLAQSRDMRSVEAMRIHVQLLVEHIGHLEPHQVHDATLAPLISERIAAGVCTTTINRTLEVARTILHRAARSYRDEDGRPWLEALPPLITMLPECPRSPYPITWAEQDRLFPRLPAHLARMALFAVNTGLRDSNLCGLQWSWEVFVPEIGRSVFVVPEDEFKAKRPHVVILNDVAWSIIQTQRGRHAVWVFPYRGRRVARMNNSAWRQARRDAGLRAVRVHDLRHTYACRLRAAGVSAEDRAALLGHATQSMVGHYASADVGRLLREANLVLNRQETRTVLRVANG
jgi:integrase